MRVLHVVPSLALRHGGVSVSVRELCRGLSSLGVEVHLWSTRRAHDPAVDGPADRETSAAGVGLRYFPTHPWGLLGNRYAYSPALARALAEFIPQVDLVHIHALWLHPTWAAARRCRRSQVPYVLSPCGALDPYSLGRRRILKRLYGHLIERRNLESAAALHFTSPLEQRRAWAFGLRPNTVVIPRSINPDNIPSTAPESFRRQHPEAQEPHLLLFMSRLHRKKRLDIVADAFLRVAKSRTDVRLVVAGPDGGEERSLRRRIGGYGLLNRVTFCGLLAGPQKWAAFKDSRLFLLPSEDENFGVAALEAMAAGLPPLLSDQVGVAETAAREGAGRMLPRRPEVWASAISEVLESPPTLQRMSESSRRLVRLQFSTDRVAAAMRGLYREILERGRPR